MNKPKFDFGGWATKNDLLCADGRTIRRNAFKDDDGRTVPLVWQHNHEDPTRVIGHALLENRDEGVYAYCSFNATDMGRHVKECVRHHDVNSLSIYANKLRQSGGDVMHGVIREVSVVLAGANPGAVIDFPIMEHGEESESEAIIWTGDDLIEMGPGMEIRHAAEDEDEKKEEPKVKDREEPKEEKKQEEDNPDETVQDVLNSMTKKQRDVVEFLVGKALEGEDGEEVSHADTDEDEDEDDGDGETVADVMNTMSPKQKKVTEFLIAQAIQSREDGEEDEDEDEESEATHYDDEGEEFTMRNVFESNGMNEAAEQNVLSHAQMETLLKDGKRMGSLRDSVLAHTAEYGIDQIDWLFPDNKNYTQTPQFIQRDQGWVSVVLNGVHHTPFSRIKTMFADITEDEARAKGYIKGHLKKNEVFTLLKRSTDPQTIYKKQKMDRDDVLDITDFDVVAWLKGEMRMMLDEEIARAVLIGDGRDTSVDDHISEDHIRSVFRDSDLYVIHKALVEVQDEPLPKTFIKTVRKAWKDYKGSGNCIAFVTEDWLSDLLLLEDRLGHFMYPNKETLANVLGVKQVVSVPVMADDSTVRTDSVSGKTYKPAAIILNLNDYNVGADKGGSVNMFEDFDIDYNAQKYLIETRCSGAMVKPYAAIVIEEEVEVTAEPEPGNP